MREYDPRKWYWYVGGDTSKAYSSAINDYVQSTDAGLQAFLADGNVPPNCASETDLGSVLSAYDDFVPVPASVLDGYKTSRISNANKVMLRILFNHENRIRALESKAALTQAQFLTALKAVL
jgi:hypothetical protein